jgi:hypothetical protein
MRNAPISYVGLTWLPQKFGKRTTWSCLNGFLEWSWNMVHFRSCRIPCHIFIHLEPWSIFTRHEWASMVESFAIEHQVFVPKFVYYQSGWLEYSMIEMIKYFVSCYLQPQLVIFFAIACSYFMKFLQILILTYFKLTCE